VRGTLLGNRHRKGSVEVYDNARYFAVTGCHLGGTPSEIARPLLGVRSGLAHHN